MKHKYLFLNDYSEGCHPNILKALNQSNSLQELGYGKDKFSLQAANLIKKVIQNSKADVHFIPGGTLTNLIAMSSLLKPFESIISANTGHINIHEAGAIEATGHKINSIETTNGKITENQIKAICSIHTDEHMVKPKVVFVSQSTEEGTLYTKKGLSLISKTCKELHLYLYLDGARLGPALTAPKNDLSLPDIAKLTDVFYIGGTKNGALFGEAIVINNPQIQKNFRYLIKQRGGLLAKGRVVGIQFLELFKNDLFFKLAKHANKMAAILANEIWKLGFKFQTEPLTNQIFPIFPNKFITQLEKKYGFYVWSKVDKDNSCVRLVTSWATKKEAIESLVAELRALTLIKPSA